MPASLAWTCIVVIAMLSATILLTATKARLRGRGRKPLLRAQEALASAFGFVVSFGLMCLALPSLPGLSHSQTTELAGTIFAIALILAVLTTYLGLVRIPGMALVGVPIPRWLLRVAMAEEDSDGKRHAVDTSDN